MPPILVVLAAASSACGDGSTSASGPDREDEVSCSIPASEIFTGGPGKDGIPALTDPILVEPGHGDAAYLNASDRVIGVVGGEQAVAVPLNIMWWHEVVNLDVGGHRLAVTHCPLTGSTLAFDRDAIGGVTLGVSGLLYRNNLIMYDRSDDESLWPQLLRGARCGPRDGARLPMFPVIETTWQAWQVLYPQTRVVGSQTNHNRDYTVYPYGDYDRPDNRQTLFPLGEMDLRRPPKERVLGIPVGSDAGMAFPFGELGRLGPVGVVDGPEGSVVLWDRDMVAAMAYRPVVDGAALTLVAEDGHIRDLETGSTWEVDGRASGGPLRGRRLGAFPEAYVAFWFAWAAFQPRTALWTAPS